MTNPHRQIPLNSAVQLSRVGRCELVIIYLLLFRGICQVHVVKVQKRYVAYNC